MAVGGYGRARTVSLLRRRRAGAAAGRDGAGHARRRDASSATTAARAVEGFSRACWDIGLEIGASVRTVDECVAMARSDVTVQTALLEARLLCGSRRAVQRVPRSHPARRWMRRPSCARKTLEMRQRHTKYEDTPYSLEPNCKESPGGLRDLQVVIWVARAAGLGPQLDRAGRQGPDHALRGQPAAAARRHAEADPRPAAPGRAGGARTAWCSTCRPPSPRASGCAPTKGQRSSELLMHRYYWAAKAVTQLNQILMLNIEERVNGSETAPMRPINAQLPRPRRHARGGARRPVRAAAARDPRDLPGLRADAGHQGLVGAHAARAVQRAQRDGRRIPARPVQPRACSWTSCASRKG